MRSWRGSWRAAARVGAILAVGCSSPSDTTLAAPDEAQLTCGGEEETNELHRRPRGGWVQSPILRKFVTSLPGVGEGDANELGQFVPAARKRETVFAGRETDLYELKVSELRQRLHPDLPGETRLFGYSDDRAGADEGYLGGVIVAKRGRPALVFIRNDLPNRTLVPADLSLGVDRDQAVGDLPFNRVATHLHGGFDPWFSDGTPFQWYTPTGRRGPSFLNVPGTSPPAGTASYYFTNALSARMHWYHDHAIGLTHENVYSGILSTYFVTDDFEQRLIDEGILPGLGIPLVIQDKSFVPPDIERRDPGWRWGEPGDLWYPRTYQVPPIPDFETTPFTPGTGRYAHGPVTDPPMRASASPLPEPSIIPEANMDTPLVNGAPYPVLRVTDRRARLRILNGSNARFWHLNLYEESATIPGEPDFDKPGPALVQIANEGGFLPAWTALPNGIPILPERAPPQKTTVDPAGPFNLLLTPAERADVLVDFGGLEGKSYILYNDAPAPFPRGDARNDYYTGNADLSAFGGAPTTERGFGPNTRTVLRVVVSGGPADEVPTAAALSRLTAELSAAFTNGVQPPPLYTGGLPYAGPVDRRVTLNEDFDRFGRLVPRLGTAQRGLTTGDGLTVDGRNNQRLPTFGIPYMDPPTETPTRGAVETWEVINRTRDTHPIHLHLVNFQVIQRAALDPATIDTTLEPAPGSARPPDPNERGWKETVRVNPREILTLRAEFSLPVLPPSMGEPLSPRTGGHEYLWHCHMLEHEDHDMMRPLVVGGRPGGPSGW